MGNLKPIGSEKLQGMDKINRIMEIARYKENKPTPINETSSNEYSKVLPDGNKYEIVKEKNGYVIKKQISENVSDYVEPMKNRKYYSSYSQALKRLNLIIKEVNSLTGNKKNVSLFNESELDEKETKYYLKLDTKEQADPNVAPAPAPAPAPVPAPSPSEEPPVEEPPVEEPMDTEDVPEPDTEGEDKPEEKVTFKTIQKLTGKLGQKLRVLSSDEEQEMSSNDVKYVINSILSALDLDKLEDEDKEQIMSKFESEDLGNEDNVDNNVEDMGDEEVSVEEPQPPSEEPAPEEMGEETEDVEKKLMDVFSEDENFEDDRFYRFLKNSGHKEYGDDEDDILTKPKPVTRPDIDIDPDFDPFKNPDPKDDPEARMRSRRNRHNYKMFDDEMESDSLFSESKVDSILKKYFKLDEKEKKMLQEQKQPNKKELIKKIKQLSENIVQEVAVTKLLTENKNTKLLGKTNKNNIVVKVGNKEVKISPDGNTI